MQTTRIPKPEWPDALRAFSDRNAGRRTSLEVLDPTLGAQRQQHEYQLFGVTYDPHDERVQIMLGTFGGVGPHVTHTIGGVRAIDILSNDVGHDTTLRVEQPDAQTLLRIER
ncbi:MAG: DUF5335 domain-containing protein [Gemmatimonadetes bacterium]|nr:DUF5335 domain-containing protein [Gemmatimonadota bacterium]